MTTILLLAVTAVPAQSAARLSDEQVDQVSAYAQAADGYRVCTIDATARASLK